MRNYKIIDEGMQIYAILQSGISRSRKVKEGPIEIV
jgi:hypothetical protein